jgi:hypothetical protein
MATLSLAWRYIPLSLADTPAVIWQHLAQAGVDTAALGRSVYVIRLNEPFAIDYPRGVSPVLYIGEGDFVARVSAHRRTWLQHLPELVETCGLQVAVATPRVRNNTQAYRHVEALLIDEFAAEFGTAPLNNKQYEHSPTAHEVVRAELREPLLRGKGSRYTWALRPLQANVFAEVFARTHLG